jgi:tetratricopeptide (TPR) repeat protein
VASLSLLACLLTPAGRALAAGDAGAEAPLAPNVAAARRHYDKARADYAQGAYHEAVTELEAARSLDPTAKDLVFNLAVVHEKLGDIDDALRWLKLYGAMNITPQESDRAEAYVRRLEGAKTQVDKSKQQRAPEQAPAPAAPAEPSTPPSRPRFDTGTIAAAGVAAGGLVVGIVMGVKALADQPSGDFVTGRDGTYADLAHQAEVAHGEAVAADVGFGVAVVAGITAAYLYLSRSRARPAAPGTTGAPPALAVQPVPLAGGGAGFLLVGRL